MFLSWHLILLITVFDLVFGISPENNNKTHHVTKKHASVAAGKEGTTLIERQRKTSDERSNVENEDSATNNDTDNGEDDDVSDGDSAADNSEHEELGDECSNNENEDSATNNDDSDNDEDSCVDDDNDDGDDDDVSDGENLADNSEHEEPGDECSNDENEDSATNNDDTDNDENSCVDDDNDDGDDNDVSDGENLADNSEHEEPDVFTRSLQTGDTFTPMEFLPIATKLLAKVEPGEGRGIVTGSKTPEDLADKLFAAYFLTSRRIVELTEKDLSGLDALTALALEGEEVKLRSAGDSLTEKPFQPRNINGQYIGVSVEPMRCHYKLLYKKLSPSETILRKQRYGTCDTTGNLKKVSLRILIIGLAIIIVFVLLYCIITGEKTSVPKMKKHLRPSRNLIAKPKSRQLSKAKNKLDTKARANNNAAEGQKLGTVKKNQKKRNRITRQKPVRKGVKKGVRQHRSKAKHKHRKNKRQRKLRQHRSKPKHKHRQNKRQRKPASNKKSKNQRKRKLRKKNNNLDSKSKKNMTNVRSGNNSKVASHKGGEPPLTTTVKPSCRWRYICQDPADLDTCRLHTSCYDGANNEPMLDETVVDTKDKDIKDREKDQLVLHFRKMLGLSALDEEVEKIIEQHVALVKPENMGPDEKIETLDQYFNNIIMAQHAMYTTPEPDHEKQSEQEYHRLKMYEDEHSSERRSQQHRDVKPLIGIETAEGLRNRNGETVKEPSASPHNDENKADRNAANSKTTQKFRGPVESTVSMKSSTVKYIM